MGQKKIVQAIRNLGTALQELADSLEASPMLLPSTKPWLLVKDKPENNLLNRREAADYLGVSKRTLSRWKLRKYGPPSFEKGQYRYFRKQDLDDWLASR